MKFSFTLLILGLSVCCNGYLDSNNMYSGQPEEKKNSDTAGSKEMSTLEKKKYLAAKYFSPGDKRPFMEKLASMSSEDKAIVFECAKNSSDISAAHVDKLDPESTFYSKKTTINSWLASHFQKDEPLFIKIQRWVFELEDNRGKYISRIPDEIPNVDFGMAFSSEPTETAFLKHVKETSLNHRPISMTFAGGFCYGSPKSAFML